jgi:hypothetical protein
MALSDNSTPQVYLVADSINAFEPTNIRGGVGTAVGVGVGGGVGIGVGGIGIAVVGGGVTSVGKGVAVASMGKGVGVGKGVGRGKGVEVGIVGTEVGACPACVVASIRATTVASMLGVGVATGVDNASATAA